MKQAKKIIKDFVKKALSKPLSLLAATHKGKMLLSDIIYDAPQVCIEAFGKRNNMSQRFENVLHWPEGISNFEDLIFLFSATPLNMGVANLCLDEAAYIYKLIKSLKKAELVEIGRFKGGGTFLMAAAMDSDSHLRSYDLHVKLTDDFDGREMDKNLEKALLKYDLADKVEIIVANSHEVNVGTDLIDFLFIDGDHSYEGVKKDFLHWHKMIKSGGHVLFHDAAQARKFTTYHEEVGRFMKELQECFGKHFIKIGEVASIVHFQRNQKG